MTRYLLPLLLMLGVVGSANAQSAAAVDTFSVSDRFLAKSTSGANIFAKFATDSIRAAELRLDRKIGSVGKREYVLGDILVKADFNGNGAIARWMVVGPASLIGPYVERLRVLAQNPNIIYDFDVRRVFAICACD